MVGVRDPAGSAARGACPDHAGARAGRRPGPDAGELGRPRPATATRSGSYQLEVLGAATSCAPSRRARRRPARPWSCRPRRPTTPTASAAQNKAGMGRVQRAVGAASWRHRAGCADQPPRDDRGRPSASTIAYTPARATAPRQARSSTSTGSTAVDWAALPGDNVIRGSATARIHRPGARARQSTARRTLERRRARQRASLRQAAHPDRRRQQRDHAGASSAGMPRGRVTAAHHDGADQIDGGGWQGVGISGSATWATDYEQTTTSAGA